MRIFGLGVPELLVILAIILLIFGPKNLPKLGSALGKTVKSLREGMGAGKKEAQAEPEVEETKPEEVVVEATEAKPADAPKKTVRKVVVKKAD